MAPEDVDREAAQTVDAAGLVVMPGGVDIHAHIVGGEVNLRPQAATGGSSRGTNGRHSGEAARGLRRDGPLHLPHGLSLLRTRLHNRDAGVRRASGVRRTHEELEDVPNLDKGAFIVMGNNHFVMKCIADRQPGKARDYVAWLLGASRGYAIKVVNPGGVENWKWGKNVADSTTR